MNMDECEVMAIGEDLGEEEMTPSSSSGSDNDDEIKFFRGSLNALETLARMLLCVKCHNLPLRRVYTLGSCHHKYCDKCVTSSAGKPCVICKLTSYPKDVRPDLFSTSILNEIPAVYAPIYEMEKLSCANSTGDDAESAEEEEEAAKDKDGENKIPEEESDDDGINDSDLQSERHPFSAPTENSLKVVEEVELIEDDDPCDVTVIERKRNIEREREEIQQQIERDEGESVEDIFAAELNEEVYENTPQNQILPKSPEFMEETPQHKANVCATALTLSKKRRSSEGRKLKFPKSSTPKKKKKKIVEDKNPMPSPDTVSSVKKAKDGKRKDAKAHEVQIMSDEELFKSPFKVADIAPIAELPVLTPHARGSQLLTTTKLANSEAPHNSLNSEVEVVSVSSRGKQKKFFKSKNTRSSDEPEPDPPTLTPHHIGAEVSDKGKKTNIGKTKNNTKPKVVLKSKGFASKPPQKEKPQSHQNTSSSKELFPLEENLKSKSVRIRRSTIRGKPADSQDSADNVITDLQMPSNTSKRKRRASSIASNSVSNTSISLHSSSSKEKERRNEKGETPLHVACRTGNLEKVKTLVEDGANVDAVDNCCWTPLHEAIAQHTNPETAKIVRYLCEKGCNVNVIGGPEDETPLHSAAFYGSEEIVEILLQYNASPNIRNSKGKLPVDIALNDVVANILYEKIKNSSFTSAESSRAVDSSVYNSALTTVVDEDPAVIQIMMKKAFVYFNYEVDKNVLEKTKNILKLKVSDKLTSSVTHIVHQAESTDSTSISIPFSFEYLYGLALGMWQVSHEWIEKSIHRSSWLSPTAFEVSGSNEDSGAIQKLRYPGRARMNKEKGNPGLLDGFTFYLYKSCGYVRESNKLNSKVKLGKRDFNSVIQGAGGKITNREPDPDSVDPCLAPSKFHVNSEGTSPFEITSHIILYDEKEQPSQEKKHTLEHVKTLRLDWVVESICKFNLEDPGKFL